MRQGIGTLRLFGGASAGGKAIKVENAEIPVVNAEEEREVKMAEEKRAKEEPVQIPATSYDAPEAKYDAEAAEVLYKAGESYFAMNDFAKDRNSVV